MRVAKLFLALLSVTLLTAATTSSTHGLVLTWTLSATPGITSQIICRSTTSGGETSDGVTCVSPFITLNATTTTIVDTTGTPGVTYYYIQESCIGAICSAPSGEVSMGYPPLPGTGLAVKRQ